MRRRSLQTGFFLTALIVALVLGLAVALHVRHLLQAGRRGLPHAACLLPARNGRWRDYRELINLSNVPIGFRNSTIVSTLSSTLGVVLSIGLCYVLTRFPAARHGLLQLHDAVRLHPAFDPAGDSAVPGVGTPGAGRRPAAR